MKLVGYRKASFTAQDTGEVISGCNLYFTYTNPNVQGLGVERVFASDRKLAGYVPVIGDEVQVFYNKYGRLESLSVLPPASVAGSK